MVKCPGCGEDNPPKFRHCGYCGMFLANAEAPLPVHEVRKTVTIVFCDLKDSTALAERLDPEVLHEVKERYFNALAAEIARHGGKIEKYIGDAIMAVFGLPRAHEDDALRAVRATLDMREALGRVNDDLRQRYGLTLTNRTGINTGEVVAKDDPDADQKLATGDTVNVAARLEQAAPAGEIYLGEATWQLVRDAVDAQSVEPLALKGKAQPVAAWRLVATHGVEGKLRRTDTPIVGRDYELSELSRLYRETLDRRCVRLATVIGDAGAGKSRLVHEVVSRIGAGARVLHGRCLAYGDGITFWPLREMLAAATIRDDDTPQVVRAKLLGFVGDDSVVDRIVAATGLSAETFPLHEVYWAARRLLEILAADAPVVAVIDDIHWAEPAFLDLLVHVLEISQESPVLLLATARPDLLRERPAWGQQDGSVRIVLPQLSDDAAAEVVRNVLGAPLHGDLARRIVRAADGNPLYVEQVLSMLVERGSLKREGEQWVQGGDEVEISVPPTIQALLEARLDRLTRPERAAIDPASVIGVEFAQSALCSLVPDGLRDGIHEHLGALAQRQLIRVSHAIDAEQIYRFQHQMVRDTVYGGLLKRARAALHLEFVRWADRVSADRQRGLELQEILGYHLEQAWQYLTELGPLDEAGVAVGIDAASRLGQAAQRAFARSDFLAAINLYKRATRSAPEMHEQRLRLLPELGEALMEVGRFAEARAVIDEAISSAEKTGDARLLAAARLRRMFLVLFSGEPGDWGATALQVAGEAVTALVPLQAHDELALAWRLTALVHGVAGRYLQANEATLHYISHARAAGNRRLIARSGLGLANGLLPGPTPVLEGIERCEHILAEVTDDRQVGGIVWCIVGELRAMNGEFDEARAACHRGRHALRELGQGVKAAHAGAALACVELLAGDPAAAERELRGDFDYLVEVGESYMLSSLASVLARAVLEQGRPEEALALSERAEKAAAADDVDAQVQWRVVRAPVIARRGAVEQAESLMREALELAFAADAPSLQAQALCELAEVLVLTGRLPEAASSYEEAAALWEAKGDRVSTQRAQRRATELAPRDQWA